MLGIEAVTLYLEAKKRAEAIEKAKTDADAAIKAQDEAAAAAA